MEDKPRKKRDQQRRRELTLARRKRVLLVYTAVIKSRGTEAKHLSKEYLYELTADKVLLSPTTVSIYIQSMMRNKEGFEALTPEDIDALKVVEGEI